MKTTIDLPDDILRRTKIVAAQRRTTLEELFLNGLELVLKSDADAPVREAAMARLRQGLKSPKILTMARIMAASAP